MTTTAIKTPLFPRGCPRKLQSGDTVDTTIGDLVAWLKAGAAWRCGYYPRLLGEGLEAKGMDPALCVRVRFRHAGSGPDSRTTYVYSVVGLPDVFAYYEPIGDPPSRVWDAFRRKAGEIRFLREA